MSSTKDEVAPDDVMAMLLGGPTTSPTRQATVGPVSDGPVRGSPLARCAVCREQMLGLWRCDNDSAWLEDRRYPDQFAVAVRSLKRRSGKSTIYLCSWCLDELDQCPPTHHVQLSLEV